MANHNRKTRVELSGRVCTRCNEFKPWAEYATYSKGTCGHRSDCKACARKRARDNIDYARQYNKRLRVEEPWKVLFASSKRRNLEHLITLEDVRVAYELTGGVCPVTGCCRAFKLGEGTQGDRYASPSLDRIDSSLGYVPGNIWVICFECNSIKRHYTSDRLRLLAESIDSARSLTGAPGPVIDKIVIQGAA